MKFIGDLLCRAGFHKLRFTSNHKWCLFSIAGCDHYLCAHCGKEFHRSYKEHPHERRNVPQEGARGSLR